jgi:hypothetical protein
VPSDPDPADESVKVPVDVTLAWDSSDPEGDALSYDVYFGTDPAPPLAVSDHPTDSYSPGTLSYDTNYYWQIIASDGNGHTTEGPVWSFISEVDEENLPPDMPSNPFPADGELLANPDLVLTWEGDDPNFYDTVTFDVYFGEPGQMTLVGDDITENQFAVGGLATDHYYEWKVVAFDDEGLFTEGPVWTFKTKTDEELIILTVNAEYRQGKNFISTIVDVYVDNVYVGFSDDSFIIEEPGTHDIRVSPYIYVQNSWYEFDRWAELRSKDNPVTVDITDDITLTAQYKKTRDIIWILP